MVWRLDKKIRQFFPTWWPNCCQVGSVCERRPYLNLFIARLPTQAVFVEAYLTRAELVTPNNSFAANVALGRLEFLGYAQHVGRRRECSDHSRLASVVRTDQDRHVAERHCEIPESLKASYVNCRQATRQLGSCKTSKQSIKEMKQPPQPTDTGRWQASSDQGFGTWL
jgi:hypothetical protein